MAAVIRTTKFVSALTSIDPKLEMWLRVRNNSSLEIGPTPDSPTHIIDFAREKVISLPLEKPTIPPSASLTREMPPSKSRGGSDAEPYPSLPMNGRFYPSCSFKLRGNEISARRCDPF